LLNRFLSTHYGASTIVDIIIIKNRNDENK